MDRIRPCAIKTGPPVPTAVLDSEAVQNGIRHKCEAKVIITFIELGLVVSINNCCCDKGRVVRIQRPDSNNFVYYNCLTQISTVISAGMNHNCIAIFGVVKGVLDIAIKTFFAAANSNYKSLRLFEHHRNSRRIVITHIDNDAVWIGMVGVVGVREAVGSGGICIHTEDACKSTSGIDA
ncbi:hypothetical protein ES703_64248 [subsurface metagenome]